MPAYLNRGATYTEEPTLPEDQFIDLLAQTNAKVEHFDISPDGKWIAYVSALSGGFDLWICDISGEKNYIPREIIFSSKYLLGNVYLVHMHRKFWFL